ncbi:MAG: multifunctional oxoglutarate decarboxylase/oxoglutarate dehydrogenase thiamine pyrophosphate-binding subunit/dihydrolipoyllysine-residue succinyltransferase subunit [Myxococcales bacterium]|nr:MAG: multifunctional oxoglutarate decarboxylase/oxoglutarate dehydrogenase thiamine pyrophosphate-binding subunit/dihydrolipoyllysine-residue succinyltransferase subunit [Myxococcales bacterium]
MFGLNESYVEILRSQWIENPLSVGKEWRDYFEGTPVLAKREQQQPFVSAQVLEKSHEQGKERLSDATNNIPLVGIARKIAQNMQESLSVPTATSVRTIPVKVLEENRLIINEYLNDEAEARCSYTHIIAYALVKALKKFPSLNNGYSEQDKQPAKVVRKDINLGLAIDLPGRDGGRTLVVPNIKAAQNLDFAAFFKKYNEILALARTGKLDAQHFMGTSVTLTNPGGLGTVLSNPRLMQGQGCIIATGSIGYPAEYEAASPETLQLLGIGKVMSISSTYDHRIIQGAESGRLLSYLHDLLVGEDGLYQEIYHSLKIPHQPYRLRKDEAVILGQHASTTQTERAMRVSQLIHAYRRLGFLLAHVDPLHLIPQEHPELDLKSYGLTIWDLDRPFDTLGLLDKKTAPLREILQRLRETYCRRMGVEYMYIHDVERRNWLQHNVEKKGEEFSIEEKKRVLHDLVKAEGIEHFLHKRFVGHKRFSIEGAEVVITLLRSLLDSAAAYGASEAVIGMAHRGRLNVLTNIVGKPYEAIFAEFDDIDPKTIQGTGDVKYHLGAKGIHRYHGPVRNSDREESRALRVELACNPSHLEAVNPIVEGIVRAKQDLAGDRERDKIIPILIHGDAAFAGQGVVYETLQLSGLQGFRTGGTVHIIINNQIGYTTPPERARTSQNCSDIGRAVGIPVFRVNGDSPEAGLRAIRIAFEYRARFKSDVIVDVVCYRRHGHNEGDEPSFTQPILYRAIKDHPSVAQIYADFLIRRQDITAQEVKSIEESYHQKLEMALLAVREKGRSSFSKEHVLDEFDVITTTHQDLPTAVDEEILKQITERTTYDPELVELHPRVVEHVLNRRKSMLFGCEHKIDFGAAEILAYGSLLMEGTPVRMSGQDCGRGTFAHRHAVLYDINDGRPYIPLNHLRKSRDEGEEIWQPSRFRIYDSPLSEEGVLGFEYGYSVSHPSSLVVWEAQFGDFFNGAQIQIDQFISSSEAKWGQKSRLVMMLPHGYDGQGPEHSSARIERFLQLCAQGNMRVCNCSTPAQLFHLLRRQAKQKKKPLIIFSHKSLLRAEDAASLVSDLSSGSFQAVIPDAISDKRKTLDRLIFVSGKIYWDLVRYQKTLEKIPVNVRLVRLEQLYPFPTEEIMRVIEEKSAREIIWLQEEPRNSGAFLFVKDQMSKLNIDIRYVGRAESASPATGSPKIHKLQQARLLEAAFAPLQKAARDLEIIV